MSSCHKWMGLVVVLLSIQSSYSIEISFSASNGGESVSIWNYYDVDDTISVSETAIASFGSVEIGDSRSVYGSGDLDVKQGYSNSNGMSGLNAINADEATSIALDSSANINLGSLNVENGIVITEATNVDTKHDYSNNYGMNAQYEVSADGASSVGVSNSVDVDVRSLDIEGTTDICDAENAKITQYGSHDVSSSMIDWTLKDADFSEAFFIHVYNPADVETEVNVSGMNVTLRNAIINNSTIIDEARSWTNTSLNIMNRLNSASGATRHKPITYIASPNGKSLQEIINDAYDGDGIQLNPGTYNQHDILINKSLEINGLVKDGSFKSTINGNNLGRIFKIAAWKEVNIADLAITGGQADKGGGIYCNKDAKVTLTNCRIYSNEATSSGGGIYCEGKMTLKSTSVNGNTARWGIGGGICNNGTMTLEGTNINDNTAKSGGGIYNAQNHDIEIISSNICRNTATAENGQNIGGGGIDNWGTATITGSTISQNSAYDGGGIYSYLTNANVTVTASTIEFNTASRDGGAICNRVGSVAVDGSTISNNQAKKGGGIFNNNSGIVSVDSSTISNNQAEMGGGICNEEGTVEVTGSSWNTGIGWWPTGNGGITGNTATDDGGGIWNDGIMTLNGSIISNNEAVHKGGGIYNDQNGEIAIDDYEITGNMAEYGGGIYFSSGNLTATNSQISNNRATFDGAGIYNEEAEIGLDNCRISDNRAYENGGGIYNTLNITAIDCEFNRNSAMSEGGGIYSRFGYFNATDCYIEQNRAEENGGGIYINGGNLTLQRCRVCSNEVNTRHGHGGGIYNNLGTVDDTTSWIYNNEPDDKYP